MDISLKTSRTVQVVKHEWILFPLKILIEDETLQSCFVKTADLILQLQGL